MNQNNKKTAILSVLFIFCCLFSFSRMPEKIYRLEKIWDQAPHNAFTDLIKYDGKFYCTFREGTAHIPAADNTGNGQIRILVSEDGSAWESAGLLSKEGIDLRDPKLSVHPNGSLMVSIGGSVYNAGKVLSRAPYVSFFRTGEAFSDPRAVLLDPSIRSSNDWLWRVTWNGNTGYGVVYQSKSDSDWKVWLVKTADGIDYQLVTALDIKGQPNESTIEVMQNGEMRIIVRREGSYPPNHSGCLGYSSSPFTDWTWYDLGTRLGGPDIITLPGGKTIIGSRSFKDNKTCTSLFGLNGKGKAVQLLDFPSGGDTSYPGMLIEGNELWMSYYSTHEGKTAVYLAKTDYGRLCYPRSAVPDNRENYEKVVNGELTVISFNIRQSNADVNSENKWDNRKEACKKMINELKPDLFGLQEAQPAQVNYMTSSLPAYGCVTAGRDNGLSPGKGENMSVFYLKERFTLLDSGHFWLSETPDEVSRGWDGQCNRMTTWVKLQDKKSDKIFFMFNTHIDHAGADAKKYGVQLVAARAKEIAGNSTLFITGDFNMSKDNAKINPMFNNFSSVRDTAPVADQFGTTNNFQNANSTNIIDYIFYKNATPLYYRTVKDDFGVTWISDHYPVMGIFNLP